MNLRELFLNSQVEEKATSVKLNLKEENLIRLNV